MSLDYLRVIAAATHAALVLQTAWDKFGKAYLELTPAEKKEVEDIAQSMIEWYVHHYTPEHIAKTLGEIPLSKMS